MPDPVEDFGAGLETQNGAPAATVQQQSAPASPDPLMTAFRERFQGIPEETTIDQFTDRYIDLQTKAEEADTLRQQLAEFHAQQAAAAATARQQAPVVPETPTERKRRFERAELGQDVMALVQPDPSGFGYVPKIPLSPVHIAAAQQANEAASRDSQFTRELVNNPYATAKELLQDELDARDKLWQTRFEEFQSQFKPIQEQVAQSAAERKLAEWSVKHGDKLFADENTMTPLGNLVDRLVRKGVAPDEALALAEETFPTTAAAPAKPVSLSKVQNLPPGKPSFADAVRNRMAKQGQAPQNMTPYEGPTNKRPKFADIYKSLGIEPEGN